MRRRTAIGIALVGLMDLAAPLQARPALDPTAELVDQQEPLPGALEPLDYPAGLSMPWRLLQIDALDQAKTTAALQSSQAKLAASWLGKPSSLSAFVGTRHVITLNNKLVSDQIQTGTPTETSGRPSVTVEPTWCSLMDYHLFFVTVADTKLNTLLGSAHAAIARKAWAKMKPAQRDTYLSAKLPELARSALQEAATKSAPPSDALHVGLSLARAVTRSDEGASACLNLLLEQQLASRYTVARSLGSDHLALSRWLLDQSPTPRRPTRVLELDWTHPPEAEIDRHLPTTFTVDAQVIDAVYGKHIPVKLSSQIRCQQSTDGGNGARIACQPDQAIGRLLDAEAASLKLSDWPQVAKVYRAWVYLDRGRAWGLKMNDRVVATVDGKPVKGHVVQFYGPEQKLNSPRGFPIREGAIVYVRLNQQLARKGMTFQMDPRTFPTPYPIPSNGAAASGSGATTP